MIGGIELAALSFGVKIVIDVIRSYVNKLSKDLLNGPAINALAFALGCLGAWWLSADVSTPLTVNQILQAGAFVAGGSHVVAEGVKVARAWRSH